MTPEELAAINAARQGYTGQTSGRPPEAADPEAADPNESEWYRAGRGALKGAASNVSAFVPRAVMPEGVQKWLDKPDADLTEKSARLGTEYGMLLIPGLDFGLGAKVGAKAGRKVAEWLAGPGYDALTRIPGLSQDMVPKIINALYGTGATAGSVLPEAERLTGRVGAAIGKGAVGGAMMDPKDPVSGAITGGIAGPVAGAARAGVGAAARAFPRTTRALGTGIGTAAGVGAVEAGRSAMGHGYSWPLAHAGYTLGPALPAGIAALMGRPGAAGGLASVARQWGQGDQSAPTYSQVRVPRAAPEAATADASDGASEDDQL